MGMTESIDWPGDAQEMIQRNLVNLLVWSVRSRLLNIYMFFPCAYSEKFREMKDEWSFGIQKPSILRGLADTLIRVYKNLLILNK